MTARERWLGPIAFAALGAALYARAIGIARYGDDFGFLYDDPAGKLLYYFTHRNPHHGWYRPLEASFYATVQALCGHATWPIQTVQLACHVALGLLVVHLARRIELDVTAAWLAGAWFLCAQTNAIAVASNDTFSQVSATLLGWLALVALDRALATNRLDRRWLAASYAAFAGSLLGKELALGFLPAAWWLILLRSQPPRRARLAVALGYLALAATYWQIRLAVVPAPPQFGGEGYDLRLGLNIIRNATLLCGAAALPVSTVAILAERSGPAILFGAAGALLVCLATVNAWRRQPRPGLALLALALATLAPVLLVNHVSELYLYSALPALALLFGAGLRPLVARRVGMATLVALFVAQAVAVQGKLGLMRANGECAGQLLAQLAPLTAQVPPGGTMLLVNPPDSPPAYSVYVLPGFEVLRHGLMEIPRMVGRDDFTAVVLEAASPRVADKRPGDVLVTLVDSIPQVVTPQVMRRSTFAPARPDGLEWEKRKTP